MNHTNFALRHLGLNNSDVELMLSELGFSDIEDFSKSVIPKNIFIKEELDLKKPISEEEALQSLKNIAKKNKVYKSFLGQGYYGTITPKVILRNVFENPGWYTSYTPYQPEISQGRLEALINFQTMVSDLTGLEIANASLYDGASAVAEACSMAISYTRGNTIIVSSNQSETLDSGQSSAINTGSNENNKLTLLMRGTKGFLYINDVFISELNVSSRTNSNYTWLQAAYWANSNLSGTEFTNHYAHYWSE